MKIIYCDKWFRAKKKILNPLTEQQAKERFNNDEPFFIMIYTSKNNEPTHFIEFFDKETLSVNILDSSLDEEATFSFQIITNHENIDKEKLFIVRWVIREKDTNGKQTKGTSYDTVLMKQQDIWEIQHNVYCVENDFENDESCEFYSKNKVDLNSLYKNVPKFGEWEDLLDIQINFLDE